MSTRHPTIKVEDQDLLCKNGCGFYGNPSWQFYCSVCYRNLQQNKEKNSKNVHLEISQNTEKYLNILEEKIKFVASKSPNTVKNILKLNKEIDSSEDNDDAKEAKVRFEIYLSKLKKQVANDVSKQIRKQIDALEEVKSMKIEQVSELMQTFYERFTQKIKTDTSYKGLSESQMEELLAEIERFLSIQIYDWAFKSNFSEDEIKDLELQKRIRSLHWITAEILDTSIEEGNMAEKRFLDDAITAMVEMNTVICPQDKLDCIVRCCKAISEAIQIHENAMVNADNFLPTLILVLIRANPTLLHSNIQFIMRFARPSLINSGETGYMFTNMSIAIEYINTLDHKTLNMTEQEFSDAMLGIKPVDTKVSINAKFTALKILDNNGALLKNLDDCSENVKNNLIQLEDEIAISELAFNKKRNGIEPEFPIAFHCDSDEIENNEGYEKPQQRSWDHISDEINSELPDPLSPIQKRLPKFKENWELFLQ